MESPESKYFISCVVDGNDKFYFQAELLIHSIIVTGTASVENIIVHCTESVEDFFLNYLDELNIKHVIIAPYLDKTYCNKIMQLDYFISLKTSGNIKGVLLLDLDMFFINKLELRHLSCFSGRVAGGANPPLKVLQEIFNAAGLSHPNIESTAVTSDSKTFSSYFNGGFYFIPWNEVGIISNGWKRWASWLFERSFLIEDEKARIHIDQISMCMTLASENIESEMLPSNFNFPIQSKNEIEFIEETPIYLLHYHNNLSEHGYLYLDHLKNPFIRNAAQKANNYISENEIYRFYGKFKNSKIRFKPNVNDHKLFTEQLLKLFDNEKKIKLIMHIGTPKTGTSSLQLFLDNNRNALKEEGILYPKTSGLNYYPKHQWLIRAIKSNDFSLLLEQFGLIKSQIDDTIHTIVLSTEGIYNQWKEIPEFGMSLIKSIDKCMNLKMVIWLRDPKPFVKSYYIQTLKNQRLKSRKIFGQDISLEDILESKWVQGILDYTGVLDEIKYYFSEDVLKVFKYEKDTIKQFCKFLEFEPKELNKISVNKALSQPTISLLRVLNQYDLSAKDKRIAVKQLYALDAIMKKYSKGEELEESTSLKIDKLLRMNLNELKKKYFIEF